MEVWEGREWAARVEAFLLWTWESQIEDETFDFKNMREGEG